MDDPDPDGAIRSWWHHRRHGRRDAFYILLTPVMIAAGYGDPAWGWHRRTRLNRERIFDSHRLKCGWRALYRWADAAARHSGSRVCGHVAYVMRYAARVKANPSSSLVFDRKAENEAHFGSTAQNPPHFAILMEALGFPLSEKRSDLIQIGRIKLCKFRQPIIGVERDEPISKCDHSRFA